MRKSSVNIQATHVGELYHNDRTKPTENSIFDKSNNYYSLSGTEAYKLYQKELKKRTELYTKKTGKKLPKHTKTLFSAIINLDENHSPEDLQKVVEYLENTLNTKVIQVVIHKDEGYEDETGKHVNYHAHVVFIGLDNDGRSVRKKLDRNFLRNLQTDVANILNMERGQDVRKTRRKRLNTYEYKLHKKLESETLKKEKSKDVNRAENIRLKLENKKLKTENENLKDELNEYKQMFAEYRKETGKNVKQLKEEISDLRKKMINANKQSEQKIFSAEDYKILSKLKKELNAKNVEEIEKRLKELRKKIDEKILFSNSVHVKKDKNDFNKKLYVFSKLIGGDYKALKETGLNLDDYFFKKTEDDEILVGNKQKKLYLKVSEDSITANANPAISDSKVAEEIFRLAKAGNKDIMELEPRGSAEFKRAFVEMQENYIAEILAKNPQKNLNNIDI